MPAALITASTGIGAATARALAVRGWGLFVVSRTSANCEALAAELLELGADAGFHSGDLTDPATAAAAVSGSVGRFGRIDALFNVAGISGRKFGDGPLHECTEEGWARTIDTNLTTQYRMARAVLGFMRVQEPDRETGQRGVVLNMTIILGIHPEPANFSAIAYAASKGGIIAMTRTAAAFYAPEGIRFNAIAPALVHTPMSARASEDPAIIAFVEKKQPLCAGMIPAADVAAAAVFLLTADSRSITGEVIEVDGGWNLV